MLEKTPKPSNPTINPSLPHPPLNHIPKHIQGQTPLDFQNPGDGILLKSSMFGSICLLQAAEVGRDMDISNGHILL